MRGEKAKNEPSKVLNRRNILKSIGAATTGFVSLGAMGGIVSGNKPPQTLPICADTGQPGGCNEADEDDPAIVTTTHEPSVGVYEAFLSITTKYSGSYDVGGSYQHEFCIGGGTASQRDGSRYEEIIEDGAVIDNKNGGRDNIISDVGGGRSEYVNAASEENTSSGAPIAAASEVVVEAALGAISSKVGWGLTAATFIDALDYRGNSGPDTSTWSLNWNYDGGFDAPVSSCTNSVRFYIETPTLYENIDVEMTEKANIPPLSSNGRSRSVSQRWTPYTDGNDTSGSSVSASEAATTESKKTVVSGLSSNVSDFITPSGTLNQELATQVPETDLPEVLQAKSDGGPVHKFYLPFEVAETKN